MLTLEKTSFDYINEFHSDSEYYKAALGIAYGISSESTLRMRLDAIGQSIDDDILEGNVGMFKACKVEPSAMSNRYVPVDLDVTPFDNSKTSDLNGDGKIDSADAVKLKKLFLG